MQTQVLLVYSIGMGMLTLRVLASLLGLPAWVFSASELGVAVFVHGNVFRVCGRFVPGWKLSSSEAAWAGALAYLMLSVILQPIALCAAAASSLAVDRRLLPMLVPLLSWGARYVALLAAGTALGSFSVNRRGAAWGTAVLITMRAAFQGVPVFGP